MQKRRVEEPGAAEEQGKWDTVEGKAGEMCNSGLLLPLSASKGAATREYQKSLQAENNQQRN